MFTGPIKYTIWVMTQSAACEIPGFLLLAKMNKSK